jgi:hypothetical protein
VRNLALASAAALGVIAVSACSGGSDRVASRSRSADTQGVTPTAITPFGMVNASCIAEVGPDEVVTAADAPPCPSPIADDAGSGSDPGSGDDASVPSFTVNGWVEYADWTASETPGRFATTWHVPDLPATDNGQTLFYFPSYEPSTGASIVQPVLQYGVSAAGGGSYWAIASWWVGPTGARHSSLLQVNPGDTIRGTISASRCDENGGCRFVIVTRDETIDNARQLTVVEGVPYTWTQASVFEAYNVNDCSELPPNGVTFASFVFTGQDGSPLDPTWAPEYSVPVRNCNYQVTAGAGAVTLGW